MKEEKQMNMKEEEIRIEESLRSRLGWKRV